MNYHSIHLEEIRREIGASFVGYERHKDNYWIKVVFGGNKKNADRHPLTGTPNDVTPKRYEELSAQLKTLYSHEQV